MEKAQGIFRADPGRSRIEAARFAADMAAIVGEHPPASGPLKHIDKWGENIGRKWNENVAQGMRQGFADIESGRYDRRQRMYGRWNRIKRPVVDALARVFGR